MARVVVQRGSTGSSSSNRSSSSSGSSSSSSSTSSSASGTSSSSRTELEVSNTPQVSSAVKDEEIVEEIQENATVSEPVGCSDSMIGKFNNILVQQTDELLDSTKGVNEDGEWFKGFGGIKTSENIPEESENSGCDSRGVNFHPPPPPVPPPKPRSPMNSGTRRSLNVVFNNVQNSVQRTGVGFRPVVSTRCSPTGSRPTSPRSHGETEGYNSADEQNQQNPYYVLSYYDMDMERKFETDIRQVKGFEVRRMVGDGNCLFRAVADQVYGDSEVYDLTRQLCIDYMERERDHFSQFITESFSSYCKRKRRDQVHGNNVEIQALAEMFNRPIHIYSYTTDPINIFQGTYDTDTPPILLSYHHGNHYNSLVDPRRLTVGAGLGFSSLRGRNVGTEQVKAAIKAQQEQQIENALLSEGKFISDIELTEKEIERMIIEASRAEYLEKNEYKTHLAPKGSSTSGAEPSSSGASSGGGIREQPQDSEDGVLSSSVQTVLSMGFSYLQAVEAYSIFGDDVDSMVCYLLETSTSSRREGKATE